MKTNKKQGISLIVLVITIIIMIILAAAIILSLESSGIIGKANEAKTANNEAQKKEETVLQMAELEMNFVLNDSNLKAKNGYVTGISSQMTVETLQSSLPKNYKLCNSNGGTPGDKLATGMMIQDENKAEIARIIVLGDTTGDGLVDISDTTYIDLLLNGKTLEDEWRLVACDIDANGVINDQDRTEIMNAIRGEKINQNVHVHDASDITVYTKAMKEKDTIDEMIIGFPSSYEKEYGKIGAVPLYNVKIEADSLQISVLKSYFSGKTVVVYQIINDNFDLEEKTSGYVGNDYLVEINDLFCLRFIVE